MSRVDVNISSLGNNNEQFYYKQSLRRELSRLAVIIFFSGGRSVGNLWMAVCFPWILPVLPPVIKAATKAY